ncbi:hypothetical protein LZ686_16655 [Paracoccus sp. NFXS7]|uniref:hypothetical protein n=1 Tax=Paracoccus sp. NFXS7 TaxID=2908653 RepID=UPI0032DF6B39
MDPERLKAWTPIALLLLFASILSAIATFGNAFKDVLSWINQEIQRDEPGENIQLPYPVISGYINGNGNAQDDIFEDILNYRDKIVFVSAAIDLSTGVGENYMYMETCNPYHQEKMIDETHVTVRTNGYADWIGPSFDDYEIRCGTDKIKITLKSALSSETMPGVDIKNFSGAFRVHINYEGLSQTVFLQEIYISPQEESPLRDRASKIWENIFEVSGPRN